MHSKITWPLVFLNVEPLGRGVDGYLRRSVEVELRGEFSAQPENVRRSLLRMGWNLTPFCASS
jgi:hypothetical protein